MPTVTIHSKFELSGKLAMKLTAVFTGKHELSISHSRAAAQNYRFQIRVGCEIAVLKSPVEIFCAHFIFDFCVRYTSRQTDTATCPLPHPPIPGPIKVSNSVFFLLYFTWGKRFCRQRTHIYVWTCKIHISSSGHFVQCWHSFKARCLHFNIVSRWFMRAPLFSIGTTVYVTETKGAVCCSDVDF